MHQQPPRPQQANEFWTRKDHKRFENEVSKSIDNLADRVEKVEDKIGQFEEKVSSLNTRQAWLFGALSVIVVIANISVAIIVASHVHF